MTQLEKELEATQRAFLSLQIENAQLKLNILDLRKQVAEKDAEIIQLQEMV